MANYHNQLLFSFARSDKTGNGESVVVYLKQAEEDKEYAVKVMVGNTRTVVHTSYSLSNALRELAETVAQFTNGFSIWRKF